MEKENKKWFHIFSAGKYEFDGANGEQIIVSFSNKDVEQIAKNYSTDYFEANLHVGHPEDEPPALGWIDKLKAEGGKLFCSFSFLSEAAINLVEQKHYKKCSVELGLPEGMNGKYLIGLGFTNYPRVTDLPPLQFSANKKIERSDIFFVDAINFSNHNKSNSNKMKNEISEPVLNFAQKVGLSVSEYNTDTDVLTAAGDMIAKLQANFANDPAVVGSLSLYVDKYSKMPEEIKTLKADVAKFSKLEGEVILNNAILAGKILPSQKEAFSGIVATMKPEELKAHFDKLPKLEMFSEKKIPAVEPATDGNEPVDKRFLNPDGSKLQYSQYLERFQSTKKEDKKFVAQFSMEDVKKLPGYTEEV